MNTASTNRPPIWQLIRDTIAPLGREVTYAEVKQLLWVQYPDLKSETINCQLIICSVNAPSRVHYPENKKPRLANGQYDFLYNIGRGKVVWYNPAKHGAWEIAKAADGALSVHRCDDTLDSIADEEPEAMDAGPDPYGSGLFAMEAHLRDYLAKNPPTLPGQAAPLRLFVDDEGRDGVEYQTALGPLDLLFVDSAGDLVVFELKLDGGPDKALGQILRYMGWVEKHRAQGKKVWGVIVASSISEKLLYAATQVSHVRLLEYQLAVSLHPVALQLQSA
ncbi:MAG: endonuclease NucS domain-containing protein [Pseudomonadales bacterium]